MTLLRERTMCGVLGSDTAGAYGARSGRSMRPAHTHAHSQNGIRPACGPEPTSPTTHPAVALTRRGNCVLSLIHTTTAVLQPPDMYPHPPARCSIVPSGHAPAGAGVRGYSTRTGRPSGRHLRKRTGVHRLTLQVVQCAENFVRQNAGAGRNTSHNNQSAFTPF
jgi:hypothetical protein